MKTILLTTLAFFSLAGVATAATAPAVSTSAASSVAPNSATFNGSVNPNGEGTTWYFEYGQSTNYGNKTANQNAGSGTSPVNISSSVSGLQAGKTYNFRLVATSAGGTSLGANMTLSTGTAPGAITDAASSIGTTSARFNGRVNPNGQATSYFYEYGTTTGYGFRTATQNAGSGTGFRSLPVTVSSLSSGGSYNYRIVATNAAGTNFGANQALTLAGTPLVETNPAQNVTSASVTLTGTVNPRGRSTTYRFDYGTTTAYGSRTPTQNAGSGSAVVQVSANVTGLTVGQTYNFRLVATNNVGTTNGANVSFSTAPVITITPSAYKATSGRFVRISGTVTGAPAGVKVTVMAQPFGEAALTPTAEVLTGGGGTWSYLAQPRITTTYQASAMGGASPALTVGARPAVKFKRIAGNRFYTKVSGASSFAGKIVKLQHLSNGRWVTVSRARLNANSVAIFRASALPKGAVAPVRMTLRIALSVNQAGPGYLGGLSRTLAVRR